MQPDAGPEAACFALLERSGLGDLIKAADSGNWLQVVERLEELANNHAFKDTSEKNIFLDLAFSLCLDHLSPLRNGGDFWAVLEKWFNLRKPPHTAAGISSGEHAAAIFVTLKLQNALCDWLLATNDTSLQAISEQNQNLLLSLWRQVFLDMSAPHNMLWDTAKYQNERAKKERFFNRGYTGLLAASIYYPLDADDFDVDCEALLAAPLPLHCRNTLICWLVNIPYFNGTMRHRDRLARYVRELCGAFLKRPEQLTTAYFVSLVQEIMAAFWRASYIGGDNAAALSAFGDMIHGIVNHQCPNLYKPMPRQLGPGERIRLGYISRNIYRQAVPYYMLNRVIHHDRSKFEVFVFSLAEREDDFTEMFKSNSDHFERFTDLKNFGAIINKLLASQLDILIFTDIGMDVVTYILGGLRLAPIQCAMVGHGTTTGLPTIDYYISGDFEAPNAQEQYREKLIRLPNLGAAQYPPDPPLQVITRPDIGVPHDAVLFISCANGIKHRAEREQLYLEILKRAPNAYILLKPYTTPGGIDTKLAKRLRDAATAEGVGDRLIILSSISHYRAVLGLLSTADVQLDTYPYGGWTTNMEALYVGLPIVTQEGELSRSRWGAGMLRAMGISEGIAANEEEYVAWAVRFAGDRELRERVARRIRERAVNTLFNGPAAQPAFEKVLIDLAGAEPNTPAENKAGRKQLGRVSLVLPHKIYAVTSLAPKDYPGQRAALDSWRQAGFQVVAVNPAAELDTLRRHFPDISFVAAARDARDEYKKPYVYFDELLAYLAGTGAPVGGIINSDVRLVNRALYDYLHNQATESIVFGSRFDTKSPDSNEGKIYSLGFDYFFFSQRFLTGYPRESFCLGLPWWDFWAALVPLARGWPLKRVVTPAALHIAHQAAWDKETWLRLGQSLASHFPASEALTPETMLSYLHQCAQKINHDSVDIFL